MPLSLRLYPSNLGVRIFCEGMGIFSFGSLMVHEIAKSGNLVLRCRVLPLGLSCSSEARPTRRACGWAAGAPGLPGMESHPESQEL